MAEAAEALDRPGVATGLVWTPAGGDIVFIEASKMPGGKTLTITGQLGDVMKESAQAALTWVRSRAAALGIDPYFFDTHDIHLHVPAGAVPKDGPSAGLTLAVALTSLLADIPVCPDVAMTGELTLRGRLLPVGGVKEKVLAARRAGLRRVILPARNARDLDDLGADVRESMAFVLVENMDAAVAAALARPVQPLALPRRPAARPAGPRRAALELQARRPAGRSLQPGGPRPRPHPLALLGAFSRSIADNIRLGRPRRMTRPARAQSGLRASSHRKVAGAPSSSRVASCAATISRPPS